MTTATYHVGDVRRLAAKFQVNALDADPTTITFRLVEPDGVETVYVHGTNAQLVRDDQGDFHVDWTIAKAGRHAYRFEGTGAAHAAEPGEFYAVAKATGN